LSEIIAAHEALHDKSNVYAILSLMYLNACRFKARTDYKGNILTLAEQDRSLWDSVLMQKGLSYLEKSTNNKVLSIYHILGAISAYHCVARDFVSTDWKSILSLYNNLARLDSSPVVLLNRAIAVSKVQGATKALDELEKIKDSPSLSNYHLLYSTQAEFYMQMNDFQKASISLEKAIELSLLPAERELLKKKLDRCLEKIV